MTDCPKVFNCRDGMCNKNLSGDTPFSQYQRQKIIQNTVRVPSSVYTMNLGALSVYEAPYTTYGVNWNQMSDRKEPHVQRPNASGSNPGASSTTRTRTRLRPGALSPGGSGVDIKHNSYARYLARLKGKGPVRQQATPEYFGSPILFNRAYPVYGGKVFKTGIVAGCDCPNNSNESKLYTDDIQGQLNDAMFIIKTMQDEEDCKCPLIYCPPRNQYYGYSQSDSFLLQCQYNINCGDIIPVL
jgi:hypothetical protein